MMTQTCFNRSITISRCALCCPLHHVDGASRRWPTCRSQYLGSTYSARSSPNILKTGRVVDPSDSKYLDGSSSASRSGPYNATSHLSGTIGVMGTSAASSLRFLEKLVYWSTRDGEETPPFIISNDPLVKKELFCENSQLSSDCNPALGKLRHKRIVLEQSGASCIVMPCQLLHAWHDEVSQGCSVPFLDVGACVLKELKAASFKPVEYGSNVRVGILATDNIMTTNCYLDKLESQGFEVVCPDKASMEHVVLPAVSAFRKGDMEGARNLLQIALQLLLVRAANVIILASDDFVDILPDDDPLLKKCIDPMDALVRETIVCARTVRS